MDVEVHRATNRVVDTLRPAGLALRFDRQQVGVVVGLQQRMNANE